VADRPLTGEEIMRRFLPASPFPGHLGIRLVDMGPGTATLGLPFAEALVTAGTTVHGGAVASLIDTAGMVAAWSGGGVPDRLRGATVGLTIAFLEPADGEDLQAAARVLRRGRSIVHVDVDVQTASGTAVAKGLVTYKLG
jgi:uncharacterized protein (TIGR00369 family)